VFDKGQLRKAVNDYLEDPILDQRQRRAFVDREVTFTDGSAGERTGRFLASLIEQS
jgi:hypothetical protein